jgi:FERM, RhoGEF and pleckstrin domain protein 2
MNEKARSHHYATIPSTRVNNSSTTRYQRPQHLVDRSNSTLENEVSSTSHESIPIQRQDITRRYLPQAEDQSMEVNVTSMHRYSTTSACSMSKQDVSTATDLSDDEDIDNMVIYSDINDLHKQQNNTQTIQTQTSTDNYERADIELDDDDDEIQPYATRLSLQNMTTTPSRQPFLVNASDLYATVDRKAKTKAMKQPLLTTDDGPGSTKIRPRNYSSEFIDNSIRNINNVLNSIENYQYQASLNYDGGRMPDFYNSKNVANAESSLFHSPYSHSDHYLSYATANNSMSLRPTTTNIDASGVESVDSYDSHYLTHSSGNLVDNNNSKLLYATIMKPEKNSHFYERMKNDSDRMEYEMTNYSTLQYPSSNDNQNIENEDEEKENDDEKESWQKSASCRELYDYDYDEYKKPDYGYAIGDREFLTTDRIDSPVTRYDDDFRRSNYETHRKYSMDNFEDIDNLPESKVYSSSYPGTTYNTIDQNFKRGAPYSQYEFNEFNGSQDLSHDSYELLEKSDEDFYYRFKNNAADHHARSCSLDSGNFIPTDYESDEEKYAYMKYRNEFKSRSAADIMNDIFLLDDPRDLPKEKLCVKSDGSFYKHVKEAMGTRTSSQESDLYESKNSKSSSLSKKSKDSVYHTDSKKSTKSKSGSDYNGSSPEEIFLVGELLNRKNYEMPTTTAKKTRSLKKLFESNLRNSSNQELKSETFESKSKDANQIKKMSHENLTSDSVQSSFDNQIHFSTFPSNNKHASTSTTRTSHVQSISLQNVEVERNAKTYSAFKSSRENTPTVLNTNSSKKTHIWPEEIEGLQTEISGERNSRGSGRKRSNGENNIFSFDKDKIESMTSSQSTENIAFETTEKIRKSPDYPLTPELLSEYDKQKIESPNNLKPKNRKEELMAKTHFEEYNPKLVLDQKMQIPASMPYPHATVERTKSDPNSLALANRPRLTVNSRRHTLMHQKSIDLTPADSSEDEYLYRQIPSAPAVCHNHGATHFELPQSYDPQLGQIDFPNLPSAGFEMPQTFFKEYEKRAMRDEIPYVLHKRHIMNGTAPSPMRLPPKPRSPKSPKSPRSPKSPKSPRSPKEQKTLQDFLFTKNVDLSKVDIDTLEKNKEEISHIPSPKRSDISKRLDPKVLETLNSKLSQIESDSATSSNSIPKFVVKKPEFIVAHKIDPSTIKKEAIMSGKRAVKPRSGQMKNKNNFKNRSKAKTRITSFSSDDESIDSDDVFGSAEAMPTKMEFSPPQSRKEIEPILKHEHKISQAAWARGQTMSSTEVEGSPPQCRKLADLENRYHTHKLDTNFMTSTELRRISERSISIPSSDDGDADGGSTLKCELATEIYRTTENLAEIEDLEEEEQVMKKDMEENEKFKALTNRDIPPKSKAKLLEEIIDSSMIIRSKGHAPVLFAHARLNLSEGSALTPLQRQEACNDSPTRRAKSLDTPVISLHRLPPMNAFSSKDDTVEFEEEAETLEVKKLDLKIDDDFLVCEKSLSPIDSKSLCEPPIVIEEDEIELLDRLKYIEKITLQGVKIKEKRKSKTQLKSGNQLILDIPKYKFDPLSSGNSSLKTSPAVSRTSSIESRSTRQNNATSPNKFKRAPLKPDSKKSPSKVADNSKLSVPGDNLKSCKEKSKSLEKIGSNKLSAPRGRKSITEETELEKLKRKERQQMLYESAMKQTINMLSPVKDQLPAFPQSSEIEQKEAKKEVDKKIIDNAIKSLPQDCVLIAKSPRKLDSHLAKFSRSCEESKSIEKIDKANRSFDDRNKNSELEDSEKSDNPEDTPSTIQRKILETKEEIKAHIEGTVVHKMISGKSQSLEKRKDDTKSSDFRSKTKSLDNYYDAVDPSFKQEMIDKKNSMLDNEKRKEISSDKRNVTKTSSVDLLKNEKHKIERGQVSHPETYNSDEMQAIISERRSLDLMKRSISKASEVDEKSESSLTSVSEVKTDDINLFPRIPTIECEEPSIEEDESRRNEQMKPDIIRSVESTDDLADLTRCTDEKIKQDQLAYQASSRRSFLKLNIEKSRSSDTASSEREIAERKESSSTSNSNKEKTSIEEESSVSCSIAKPLGISQDFVDPNDEMHCNKLRDRMLKLEEFGTEFHRIPKKSSPSLEKQIPIDLGSGSELDTTDPVEDRIARILQRDESDSGSERKQKPKIQKPPRDLSLHKKVTRAIPIEDLSQPPEKLQAKLNNAHKFLRATNSESSFESKSSMDSRESRDETESSSGSLGIAQRRGELAQRQMRTTWKSFPIESSGSSNENDNWNPEHETYEKYENVESYSDRDDHKESDSEIQDDGGEYQQASQSSNYQDHSSSISSNPIDVLGYGTGYAIGRTLSRISERSTNSEKSDNEEEKTSIDEDITAHEEQEVEEEQSIASSDHQASMSSEIHTNSQQAYVSDTDRRTSAEMPDIPCDSAAAERLTELYKQSITKSGRFSVQNLSEKDKLKAEFIAGSGSSQESCEDWPLPDIPDIETNPAFIMKDRPIPKIFMWRDSISGVQAEHSTDDNWPSPPDSPVEDEDVVETVYLSEPQNPQQVMVESFTETNQDEDDEPDYAEVAEIAPDLPKRDYEFSEPVSPTTIESKTSPTVSIILPYDDTSYMTKEPKPQTDQKGCFDTQVASVGCLKSTLRICSSQNKLSGIAPRIASPDKVIIHQPTRSTSSLQSPMSEEEFFMCDEVFSPGTVKIEISSDERRYSETSLGKFPRSSNNSDTSISIDDLFTGSLLDDSQRRSSGSLEPRRLSSGSCKKCSGGSHSEEETSSFGSNHDGTVKMGIPKKCTHSSHSEDTSIGVSLSEWSTGTNTVRQYANLSGSDTLSAVSNPSAHKSNNTKSSVSSINKSTESLNEKSMSLSCGKNIDIEFYENMSKDPNSDTDKVTSSGTNDESTLTLTEMVHSITEWSTSTSGTLVEQDMNKQQQMDYKHVDKSKTSIDYMPLKPPKGVKRITTNEKESMPGIHNITKTKVDTSVTQSSASTSKSIHVKIPPKIVDVIEKPRILPKPKVPSPPIDESSDKSSSNGKDKRKVLRMMSEQYKSQEVSSSDFSDKLYTQSEKLSERYQSQEFAPFTPAKPPRGDSKSISKHHSYDDKTLSKSQIREYKTTKVRQSHSFHEHLLSSDLNKIDEEKLSSSTTTHTSETSTENSSPMFQRPGRLAKCSPYYSSSLSSDTPEVHQATIHKPPRKPTMTVKTLQTQSSNDTDSSLDVMANDPSRIRAYRRKKQIPSTKRIKIDRPTELESSENSEGYHQNSSGSETAKMYPDFEEEPENIPEDYEDYNYRIESSNVASYPSTSTSAKFETLDLSENVDEMGFPRYDRLRNMTNPPTAMSSFKPPIKPVRAKKKGKIAGVHYGGQDSGSGSESKGGLSDDVCYSSEDSFVAAYNKQKVQQAAGHYVKNVELPYPDFLSDCEESGKRSNNESEKSLDSDDDDEMKRNRKATKKF